METFDVSHLAANRLDFVSALLACIALLLAASAFPLFLLLRDRAAKVAREAAKEELAAFMEDLEKTAVSRIEALLLGTMRDYMPPTKENAMSDDIANGIAGAQEAKSDADPRNPESPSTGAR